MDKNTLIFGIGIPFLTLFASVVLGFLPSFSSAIFLVAKICAALAALMGLAIAIYLTLATRQAQPWNILISGAAGMIISASLVLLIQWIDYRERLTSTMLFPRDDYSRLLPSIASNLDNSALKVIYGTNVATATKLPHTVLKISGDPIIQFTKHPSRNELIISCLKVFDDRNNIIARIDEEDGLWVENSTRKKRPDPSTIVVYDHLDKEVLRLNFANPTTLYVTGIFRHPNLSVPIVVTEEAYQQGGQRMTNSFFGNSNVDIFIP